MSTADQHYHALVVRRRAILESTYAGHKPPDVEWQKLAAALRDFGMECAAENVLERMERMPSDINKL